MNHGKIMLIGVTLAVAVVSYVLMQPPALIAEPAAARAESDDNRVAENAARIAEMEERLKELQTRIGRSEDSLAKTDFVHSDRQQSTQPHPEVGAAQPELPDRARTPATPSQPDMPLEERIAQDQVYEQQSVAALAGRLAGEEVDTDWAGNFQAALDQGLKSESFAGTRLSDVECKSSLCRVTLAHDNAETEEQFLENMLDLPVMSNTQAFYKREANGDGSASLVLYIAREGQSLPLPRRNVNAMN